jgi:hypothetical protein
MSQKYISKPALLANVDSIHVNVNVETSIFNDQAIFNRRLLEPGTVISIYWSLSVLDPDGELPTATWKVKLGGVTATLLASQVAAQPLGYSLVLVAQRDSTYFSSFHVNGDAGSFDPVVIQRAVIDLTGAQTYAFDVTVNVTAVNPGAGMNIAPVFLVTS